jgi:hypothetical protein
MDDSGRPSPPCAVPSGSRGHAQFLGLLGCCISAPIRAATRLAYAGQRRGKPLGHSPKLMQVLLGEQRIMFADQFECTELVGKLEFDPFDLARIVAAAAGVGADRDLLQGGRLGETTSNG